MTDDPQAMTAGPRTGVRPPADGVRTAEGRRHASELRALNLTDDPESDYPERTVRAIEDAAFDNRRDAVQRLR